MQNCIHCGKKMWHATGKFINGRRVCICRNIGCGKEQLEEPPQGIGRIPPKILYFDIETAMSQAYIYDLYIPSKRLMYDMIYAHGFVINWSAAWIHPKTYQITKQFSGVCTAEEAKRKDDRRILKQIWSMMEEADYWVGHNSDNFDIKMLKWRFTRLDMGYPFEAKRLDTFKLYGRETRPMSRALDYLSPELGGGLKKGLDKSEWQAIVAKETHRDRRESLLKKADKYCRGDVKNGVLILRKICKDIESSGRQVWK